MNNTEDEGIATSLDRDWVTSLEKKVSDTKLRDRNREPTIYRVPYILKMVDLEAFAPLIVSLGPYNLDKGHLKSMNQLKWKYLKFVLEELNPRMVLEDYLIRFKDLETQARVAYSEEVEMSSNSFLEMMLLDGCYVMLTIVEWNIVKEIISWTQFEVPQDWPQDWRAIVESNLKTKISEENALLTRRVVARDILMLENQLPFFLLETLYKAAFPPGPSFRSLTLEFIRGHFSISLKLPTDNDNETFHHIIHLFLSCIDPTTNHGNGNGNSNESSTFGNRLVHDLSWIPRATIPQLKIDDHTSWLLRNLIAYEQCSTDSKFHVTSYMMFMNHFIKTAADVELLRLHNIIIDSLGVGTQEIATLFINLVTNVSNSDDSYIKGVLIDIRKYRDT
ncbi:hypothetical protein ZIOFF_026845 [Zingiber officinale]|uniref:Uncharacterized protein n=2 Tax=Zingiber officinale TaxID=94328 RepID=A0A8J5H686_ZINOF|nr:hypothetical protein ZIOFF_026845 [Zingiber officinale]